MSSYSSTFGTYTSPFPKSERGAARQRNTLAPIGVASAGESLTDFLVIDFIFAQYLLYLISMVRTVTSKQEGPEIILKSTYRMQEEAECL